METLHLSLHLSPMLLEAHSILHPLPVCAVLAPPCVRAPCSLLAGSPAHFRRFGALASLASLPPLPVPTDPPTAVDPFDPFYPSFPPSLPVLFRRSCLSTTKRYVRYNATSQKELIPSIIMAASALGG